MVGAGPPAVRKSNSGGSGRLQSCSAMRRADLDSGADGLMPFAFHFGLDTGPSVSSYFTGWMKLVNGFRAEEVL